MVCNLAPITNEMAIITIKNAAPEYPIVCVFFVSTKLIFPINFSILNLN